MIKERLREAENEEKIKSLAQKCSDMEEETKKLRETVPENEVASLQVKCLGNLFQEGRHRLAYSQLLLYNNCYAR